MPHMKDIDNEDKLKQLNAYEDTLDVFIHILILRLPSAFVLINMTLMIWLVQTIYSNYGNEGVPRSLYFFVPFLSGNPIVDLKIIDTNTCESGYEPVNLKTFPTITNQSLKHSNLTRWKNEAILCQKIYQTQANFSAQCAAPQQYCSGICVNNTNECPITRIRQLYFSQVLQKYQTLIYTSKDKMYKYAISRQSKSSFIVGIRAQYEYRCANQFHYYDIYDDFGKFWNDTKNCGAQSFLSSQSYRPFDTMTTSDFLFQNGIWSELINATTSKSITELGTINKINFKNKTSECRNAESEAKNLQNDVFNTESKPHFTKILLIMSFILFTLSWAWLIAFYCFCEHRSVEKNLVVILLASVQFIVIAFIYYQNLKLLQTQIKINSIATCIDDPMTAFEHWTFNISNKSPLISLLYVCCCFLLLQFLSYYIHYCLYQPYYASKPNDLDRAISNEHHYRNLRESQH